MSDIVKNHIEQFVLVFVGYYLTDLAATLSTTPLEQVLSKGFIPALLVSAVTTAIRATYNKQVIGNSMGVR